MDEEVIVVSDWLDNWQPHKFNANCLGVVDIHFDTLGKSLAVSCLDSCIRVYNTEEP